LGPLEGLTRNVLLLGCVSFFADVSSEMLYPLIPLFLTTVLHAPVELLGVIEGLAEATASLLKPLAGNWSDRHPQQRRNLILGGYSLSALAKGVLALAQVWPVALLGRITDRIGKGVRGGPRDALIADAVARPYLGKALGWHRGMDSLGAVVGPLLALLLLQHASGGIREVLGLAVIPGLIGAALVLLVRERLVGPGRAPAAPPHPDDAITLPRRAGAVAESTAATTADQALPGPTTAFKLFLAIWAVFALTNSSDVFILLRASQSGLGETTVVFLYALYNLVYALTSPWLGQLSDRTGRKAVLIGGLLVFALVYAGFAVATSRLHFALLFGVYGLYIAATDGVSKAYAIDLVPAEAKATATGWLGFVTGIGALLASSIAGVLWTRIGPWSVFAFGAAGALFTAAALPSRFSVGSLAANP
jgi:MFS family permease